MLDLRELVLSKPRSSIMFRCSIVTSLLNDVQFIFERTVASYHEEQSAHLFFALVYFYANRNVITEVLNALSAIPVAARRTSDPHPNDHAWQDSGIDAAEVVISPVAWRNYTAGAVECPIDEDDINMLIRVLRIAERAPIRLKERHLLMSPLQHFYEVLQQSTAWSEIVPSAIDFV